MPVLMLMRHGKSSWDLPYVADHERPLAQRGVKAAAKVGRFLSAAGCHPDLVLTSTGGAGAHDREPGCGCRRVGCDMVRVPEFYGSGVNAVLEVIRDIEGAPQRLLIVGHNPTWADLASRLIGGGELRFPTAAVACVRFNEGAWSRVGSSRGELLWFLVPRLL